MKAVNVYRAGAWHEFREQLILRKEYYTEGYPPVVIIPEDEDKAHVFGSAFPGLGTENFYSVPELIERYLRIYRNSGLVSLHGVELILSSLVKEDTVTYLNMEKYRQNYITVLARFIHHFRRTSLLGLPEALEEFKNGPLSYREQELIKTYHGYLDKLPSYGYDLKNGLDELTAQAETEPVSRLTGLEDRETFLIWGFNHITPLERSFISTVMEQVRRADFFYCHDPAASLHTRRIQEPVTAMLNKLNRRTEEFHLPPSTPFGKFPVDFSRRLFRQEETVAKKDKQDYERSEAEAAREEIPETGAVETSLSANILSQKSKADKGIHTGKHNGAKNGESAPGKIPEESLTGKVIISEVDNRFAEIVMLARQLKEKKEEGVPWGRMRVVTPAYHHYSSLLQEVFPDYGIPFSLEKGVPLLRYPLARLILHLVQQAFTGGTLNLREKIFSSPYISFSKKISPQEIQNFQEKAGIELISPDKLKHWFPEEEHRLDYAYLKSIREKAYREINPPPGATPLETVKDYLEKREKKKNGDQEYDKKETGHLPEERTSCLVQFFLLQQAEKALAIRDKPATNNSDFKEAVLNLLKRFSVEKNLQIPASGHASFAKQIQERDRQVWAQVHRLLEETAVSLPSPEALEDKLTLGKQARIFARLLHQALLQPDNRARNGRESEKDVFSAITEDISHEEPAEDRVSVQPVELGQYQKWSYTFICGMVDGEFPADEEFNFLQPQKEGLKLGQPYTTVDYARYRFYHLVRSTGEKIFLSRPLSDNGRMLAPSPFIKEVEKCLAPTTPPASTNAGAEPGARARGESGNDSGKQDKSDRSSNREGSRYLSPEPPLYSKREKLLYLGQKVDRNYPEALPLLQELKSSDEKYFELIRQVLRYDGWTLDPASLSEFEGMLFHHPVQARVEEDGLSSDLPPTGPGGGRFPDSETPGASVESKAKTPPPNKPDNGKKQGAETSPVKELLADKLAQLELTPQLLEQYARCPLRFFLDQLPGLKEQPDYHPDTTGPGKLVRSVLKAYTVEICRRKEGPEHSPQLLKELLDHYLDGYNREAGETDAFQARFVKGLYAGLEQDAEVRPGLLQAFLNYEKEGPDYLKPFWGELEGTVRIEGMPEIRVEVDRVDLAGNAPLLIAFLYTTASTGDPATIRRGLCFDLPLAVLLARKRAAEKQIDHAVGGAGRHLVKTPKQTRRGGYFAVSHLQAPRRRQASPQNPLFSGQREGFLSHDTFEDALKKIQDHIIRLYRLMGKGVFHLPLGTEAEQNCDNCSWGRICRKNQLHLERLRANLDLLPDTDHRVHLVREIF